ncbi:MAG: ATP-binding cassette domain-containing protein [Cytophagales bacterium]|nr:ATP-binding cassette domain-containing protein [Bernardetiaceae bacterium]MDW8203906.1 ATP-binding cassette domain-containing protein [Cytophagales bacterium]
MSEEILKALTQLFAIISKQDTGVSEAERNFIISFYQQDLDSETMAEYLALYDKYAEYGIDEDSDEGDTKVERKKRVTRVNEAVRVLSLCRRINKTLTQKQKVIVLFKLLEMVGTNRSFTAQRMEIIQTVASVFNIPKEEYKLMESFAIEEHSSALDSEDILIFDDEPPTEGSKRRYIDSGKLDGEIIFIRVKSVDLYFIKYTGHDEIYLNGQLVKRNSIVLFSNGSIIKTPKGAPLYYSDLVSKYTADKVKNNISFNVDSVWFKFPNGTIGLRNINISESAGKLIGIMGASGAGKTTLLNVMAGLETPYQGKVTINGFNVHHPIEKKNIEGVIGYVSQDDLLIEELTVFQNLFYNAKLCFRDLSDEEITQKVVAILESLGLDRIMHLKVGNPLNKKISGGQRKRLNIALELIREPSILFLDEPTSGLSSRDSENVIDLLKELSLKGKLVFAVIHQPSSDIYKMFDKMYILDTGGYPAFYGNPIEAVTYFKKATRQVGSERGQCMTCGNVNPEQIFNIIEARVVDEYGEFTNKRKITPEEWYEMYEANFKIDRVEEVREKPPKNLHIPSKIKQTLIFATRDAIAKISNKQYLTVNLIEAPALALLMSLVIRYKDSLGKGEYVFRYNDNIPAYILICIIIALFMGLTVSAEEIISDRKILKRESFLNLSRTSYLFSKLIILFSLSAIQTLSFVVIGNLILGIDEQYITYWLILFSVSCFANVLGLNISSAFDNAVTVYVLIPLLLIPQMILSGGIFSFDKLNNAITSKGKTPLITDIWASRWAYEAICVEHFKTNPYERLFYEIDLKESVANYRTSFWLPKIDELLVAAGEWSNSKVKSEQEQMRANLAIVAHELANDKTPLPGKEAILALLTPASFNEEAIEKVRAYTKQLNITYGQIQARMADSRDSVIMMWEQQAKQQGTFANINQLKDLYYNERLAEFVKNENVLEKTSIEGNRIIQNTDPVFTLPSPQGWWDYRTHFFAPLKHFGGRLFSTYYFNLVVIWLMTVLLYIALYFEWLRKFVKLFSKLDLPKK